MRTYFFAAVAIPLSLLSLSARADLVFFENFSAGNPANSTDYTLVPAGTMTTQGNYRIVNNPANPNLGNSYGSVFDHTSGDATGEMLFFDGAASSSSRIYYQSANLTAGVQYQFSYWQEADNLGSPPNLQAYVNSTLLGSLQDTSSQSWAQFSTTYTPSTSGSYVFSIQDANTVGPLNDGALDDVQLISVPEPASIAFVAIAAAGLMLRQRRGKSTGAGL